MKTAIVGVNWGDEGKGRMVDLLSRDYEIIIRYQGGNNAGHTVINDKGKFILNLLPSGILREEAVNVMGNGMLIDLQHLRGELDRLAEAGITVSPERLRISSRASICMPYHKLLDEMEEDRLGDAKFGSTRRGIAPGYADKYMKKAFRMEDLLDPEGLAKKAAAVAEWKNLTLAGYGGPLADPAALLEWLHTYGDPLRPYICDTTAYLHRAIAQGKNLLFEAQLGSLRDLDMGIYPYTTSSNTLAAYAPIGAGIPGQRLDRVIGVVKAYSSCVGEGPFPVEMFGDEAHALREAGGEYGAATGRPRRVGGFDLVASRYGVEMQGLDAVALTKLDTLSYMERIPVCVAYRQGGETFTDFPSGRRLMEAKGVMEYLPGFGQDIADCRRWEDLPQAARDYVDFIEKGLACPIRYISVGPERDQIIYR